MASIRGHELAGWMDNGCVRSEKFGALKFVPLDAEKRKSVSLVYGDVYSYDMHLARVFPTRDTILWNLSAIKRSQTTTTHLSAISLAPIYSNRQESWKIIGVRANILNEESPLEALRKCWGNKITEGNLAEVLHYRRLLIRAFASTKTIDEDTEIKNRIKDFVKANKVTKQSMCAILELQLDSQHG